MGFRYSIREAERGDCGTMLQMIKDLVVASDTGPESMVKVTEEELQEAGFGDRPAYRCVFVEAMDDSKEAHTTEQPVAVPVGFAVCYFSYCSIIGRMVYLEDLYVHADHRRKGLGRMLISKIAKIGAENGCKGLQSMVLDSNKPARCFYKSVGTKDMTEEEGWRCVRTEGEKFFQLANL